MRGKGKRERTKNDRVDTSAAARATDFGPNVFSSTSICEDGCRVVQSVIHIETSNESAEKLRACAVCKASCIEQWRNTRTVPCQLWRAPFATVLRLRKLILLSVLVDEKITLDLQCKLCGCTFHFWHLGDTALTRD